jgi:undecaprenyl-diphosphatase
VCVQGLPTVSLGVALLLGLLQGLTEFLPVSSSGHLALAQSLIPEFRQPGVIFDAMLHVGTASAVVWFERKQIAQWAGTADGRRLLGLVVVATLATAAVGFPLKEVATSAFYRPFLVGVALVLTGVVVLSTRFSPGGRTTERNMTWKQTLVVGIAQGVAVFPGLSRSGFTIAAALGVGFERAWAARFSFLLGVPAIAGVTLFELIANRGELTATGAGFWLACVVGAAAAAVSGYVALGIVLRTLSSRVFHRFGWYCIPLGILVLVLSVGN